MTLKDFLVNNLIKSKTISSLLVLVITGLLLFFLRNSNLVIVHTNKEQKIKIEVGDMCLDSLQQDMDVFDTKFQNRKPQFLAFHCTASPEGKDLTEKQLRDIFKVKYKPYNMVGYHYVVGLRGNVIRLNPIDTSQFLEQKELVWGVKNYNSVTISVAYIGGVDKNGTPKDTRTPEQKMVLRHIAKIYKERFPTITIRGHRDFPYVPKACPSFNVRAEFNF